jgi:diguanylate cyclase (GGDEF)-like protein/PAS domain S-box-containing protein
MSNGTGVNGADDEPATTPAAGHEAAIAEAVEQRYRNLVDHNPNAICVHQDGRVVYINPAGVNRMGAHSQKQVIGHLITDFVHPDSIPSMLARIGMLRDEGDASAPSEAVLLALDGTAFDVEVVSVLTLWEGRPAYQVVFRDLTAQKAAQTVLHYQAALVNHISDALIATTTGGIVTSWNPAAEAIYGRRAAQALALPISEAVGAPTDPAAIIAGVGVLHTTHHAADGTALAVRVSAAAMDSGYVLMCSDHTALRRAEQRFRTVVDSLDEGVVVIGPNKKVESANPAAERILGIARTRASGSFDHRALGLALYDEHGQPLPTDQHPVDVVLRTGHDVKQIVRLDRSDGQRIWLSGSCCLLNPADPTRSAVLLSFVDVTAEHTARQSLSYQASHDVLTGLSNRKEIVDRANRALARGDPPLSAVMFIDLDNLKIINDSLGHHAGDHVLRLTAQRLCDALRTDDVVGRLGGDEFVTLLIQPVAENLQLIADRLHAAIAEPVTIDGHTVRVSASIGITRVEPADCRGAEDLLQDADLAMYDAKIIGTGQTGFSSGREY